MKIVTISDLHGNFVEIPECDVLCICGDIVPLEYQQDIVESLAWFYLKFIPWTDSLNCKKVIFIGGNHDFFLERLSQTSDDLIRRLLPNNMYNEHKLVYLQDQSYTFNNVKFYGTPWCPDLSNWAFYKSHSELIKMFNYIPINTDILLTHCPPRFGLVGCVQKDPFRNYGCQELAEAIAVKSIKYNLCGHIHTGDHEPYEFDAGRFVINCSVKNEEYLIDYKPYVFEYDRLK